MTTSDIQDELEEVVENAQALADFPIKINIRIYINKTLKTRKNLPDSSKNIFDFLIVEEAFAGKLETLIEKESYKILRRTAVIRANTSRATNRTHDLEDFSFKETDRVLGLVNAAREQHPRSKIAVTIEIRISMDIFKPKSKPTLQKKRKASGTDPE